MSPRVLGTVCGISAAVLFAGKAVMVRLAYSHGSGATDLLAWRMAWSLPCFALIAAWYAHRDGAVARGDRIRLLLLGVLGYHVASWLDFSGLQFIDAALERVVLFIYPTVVVGLALLRGKRGLDGNVFLALAATCGGILLTWGDRIETANAVGVFLVAASAVAFAVHLVLIEDVVKRVGSTRAMAIAMIGAATTSSMHALIKEPHATLHPSAATLSYGAALALFATVIPVLLAAVALVHLGAARAAVLGTVAPALTALLGWVVLNEHLGALGWCGIAVTMIGALLISRPPRGSALPAVTESLHTRR